mmetsp:Transcript_11967/g.37248  ORF Transcript_11967/g.37248 Transcript_11967/m.37248 type:complete len:219 (+) Transcript_11967:403-1059(+)
MPSFSSAWNSGLSTRKRSMLKAVMVPLTPVASRSSSRWKLSPTNWCMCWKLKKTSASSCGVALPRPALKAYIKWPTSSFMPCTYPAPAFRCAKRCKIRRSARWFGENGLSLTVPDFEADGSAAAAPSAAGVDCEPSAVGEASSLAVAGLPTAASLVDSCCSLNCRSRSAAQLGLPSCDPKKCSVGIVRGMSTSMRRGSSSSGSGTSLIPESRSRTRPS